MITFNKAICSNCEACASICHTACLLATNEGVYINRDFCSTCGQCIAICPTGAISWGDTPSRKIEYGSIPEYESLLELLKARRTIRRFKLEPIHDDEIKKICASAKLSPTNVYDISLVVIKGKLIKQLEQICLDYVEKMNRRLYSNSIVFNLLKRFTPAVNDIDKLKIENTLKRKSMFHGATTLILVTADHRIPHSELSCQYAIYNMSLIAQSLGIGSCISGAGKMILSKNKLVRKLLNLPKNKSILGVLLLGYPNVKFKRSVEGNVPKIEWK